MILSQSYDSATPFAETLANNGVKVEAMPNTVLYELVQLSNSIVEVGTNGSSTAANIVEAITKDSLDAASVHSRAMNAYIDDISTVVTKHINFAKNVVKPVVAQLADALANYKNTYGNKTPYGMFNIVTLKVPAILKDEAFLDSLAYYVDKAIISPSTDFKLDDKTNEEIQAFVMTGHARTDGLIGEWLATVSEDHLRNVWQTFFSFGQKSINYAAIEQLNAFDRVNYLLPIYLIARKLYDDVQATKDFDLASYKRLMAEYRDYAGAGLAACITKIAFFTKNKTMVIENDSRSKTIKLNGDVYLPWLGDAANNNNDIIMGIIVTGDKIYTQSLIDEKSDYYRKQWVSYSAYYATSENNRYFDSVKLFLQSEVLEGLKRLDPAEEAYIVKNPSYYEVVKHKLQDEIDDLKIPDMADPYAVALKLIGKARFHYTSSYDILNDIVECSKANPNIDVREAALFSAIHYLSDYIAAQIVLVKQ